MAEDNAPENAPLDLSGLGSFDFTPDWARGKADDKSKFRKFEEREERREQRPDRGERRDGGFRSQRPPRTDRDRGDRNERPRFQQRERREFIKPLDADIRILPSQKDLGQIIRKIQNTHMAYPLKQLAYLFLDNPSACMLRVIPRKQDGADEIEFYQCKGCGFCARNQEALSEHILQAHLAENFDAEVIDCEPPKGTFTCVAKCGLSGVLLGPPNLHGYDARIREVIREKFPTMPESVYRSKIEMIHDQETIEQWRASATKKTVYHRKGVENAPAIERAEAEMEFRCTVAPLLVSKTKTIDLTAEMALKTEDKPLMFACRDALSKERRFPASLFFALRGAFHHRKLAFFRTNDSRGMEFVCAVAPSPLDKAHAIPELAEIVTWVEAHPSAHVNELVAALAGSDEAKKKEVLNHLEWLRERGSVIQFFNGLLSAPCEHPAYKPPRNNQSKRNDAKTPEATAAADVPAAEEPKTDAPVAAEPAAPAEAPVVAAEEPKADAPVAAEPAASVEAPAANEAIEKKEEVKNETAPELA